MKYELIKPEYTELVDSLVNIGALRRIVEPIASFDNKEELERWLAEKPILAAGDIYSNFAKAVAAKQEERVVHIPSVLATTASPVNRRTDIYPAVWVTPPSAEPVPTGVDLYLKNGKAIEHNIEEISRIAFSFAEEKKLWAKELKLAVREHGHDQVLEGFYNWCETNSNFKGRKPVSSFLKNVSSNIGFVQKSTGFSNPNLDYVINEIGYLTDNKVMFWGNARAVLAKAIQEHGTENVLEAWRKFYNEDDNPGFAANGFISQIDILVYNVKKRKKEAENAQAAIEAAYRDAQATVQTEPEEELEEL